MCKREVKTGGSRSIEWHVQVLPLNGQADHHQTLRSCQSLNQIIARSFPSEMHFANPRISPP
jgi:hypothetical protein